MKISRNEIDRRWNRIRGEMKKLNLDCIIVAAGQGHLRYMMNANRGYAVFPVEGEPTYFSWGRATLEQTIKSVWTADVRVGRVWSPRLAERISEMGYEEGNIGIVGLSDYLEPEGWIPYTTYLNIQKKLPNASFSDVTKMLTHIRMIKSPEEIQLVKKAAQIGIFACEEMLRTAKSGLRDSELYANVIHSIFSHGGEVAEPIQLMSSGPAVLHSGHPTHRILQPGDIILTEFFPMYAGYQAHPHLAIGIGQLHKDYERCIEVVREAMEAGIKSIRPGTRWIDVCKSLETPMTREGCFWISPNIHGLSPHAPISAVASKNAPHSQALRGVENMFLSDVAPPDLILKPGMVLAVQPNACIGERGIHFGVTCLVTETGNLVLDSIAIDIQRI